MDSAFRKSLCTQAQVRRFGLSTDVALEVCCFSLYSVVKQRLKCNTGKVCNCLIQFLLTTVLSTE
jgi:hypothetical protein